MKNQNSKPLQKGIFRNYAPLLLSFNEILGGILAFRYLLIICNLPSLIIFTLNDPFFGI
jgi:hypothetical protein